jgi:hypothetical protein
MGPDFIPLMGMITGIVITACLTGGVVLVFRGPVGQALARRLQGKSGELEQEMITELQALRDHVQLLEQQVEEVSERLEFNERLLAQGRDPGLLRSP